MDDKLVYLAYENDQVAGSEFEMLACANCKNKTFTARVLPGFPELYCAACGLAIGKFGWAGVVDDD